MDSDDQYVTVEEPPPSIEITGLVSSMTEGESDSFRVSAANLLSNTTYNIRVETDNSDIGFNSSCSDRVETRNVPSNRTSYSFSLTLYACDTVGGTVDVELRAGTSEVDSDDQYVTVSMVDISPVFPSQTGGVDSTIQLGPYAYGDEIDLTLEAAEGGNPPLTYSINGLPTGMNFDRFARRIFSGTTAIEVGSHDMTMTVEDSDGDTATLPIRLVVSLPAPGNVRVVPRTYREATLKWDRVEGAAEYEIEIQDMGKDWSVLYRYTEAQSSLQEISMIRPLDEVHPRKGLGDEPYGFDIRVRAVRGLHSSPNSRTITIVDSPILRVSGDSSASPTDKGKAKVQWGRKSGVINGEYTINIRKSGRDDHYELGWVPAGWVDTLEQTFTDSNPSGTSNAPLEFNTSELELGQLYGVQISYKTNRSHVFSAVHDYVWPSSGFPGDQGRPERVATFPYFGHHADRDYAYRICTDTLPNVHPGEKDAWVALIEMALEQWEIATDGLVTATPEYVNVANKEYQECTDFDVWHHFFIGIYGSRPADDARSEIRVFDVNTAEALLASKEIASDPFKRCLLGAVACVTSRTGYNRDDRVARNELEGVDISFNLRKLEDRSPPYIPDYPTQIHFNKCSDSSGYTQRNLRDPNNSDPPYDFYLFETAVHEAGHAFGLSNVTDEWRYVVNSIPWPDWFDPFDQATYVASHPTVADSAMNYDSKADVVEQDCSPHPFDVLAIFALYQGIR